MTAQLGLSMIIDSLIADITCIFAGIIFSRYRLKSHGVCICGLGEWVFAIQTSPLTLSSLTRPPLPMTLTTRHDTTSPLYYSYVGQLCGWDSNVEKDGNTNLLKFFTMISRLGRRRKLTLICRFFVYI